MYKTEMGLVVLVKKMSVLTTASMDYAKSARFADDRGAEID
jgi:hypothetical protein